MAAYMKQQGGGGGGGGGEQGYTTPEPNEIIVPLSTAEDTEFLRSMENGVGLFEQKLARAKKRGGGVSTDTALQSIFRSLAVMHPELLSRIDNLEDEKSGCKELAAVHTATRSAPPSMCRIRAVVRDHARVLRYRQACTGSLTRTSLRLALAPSQMTA